jgi:hypothetical protein
VEELESAAARMNEFDDLTDDGETIHDDGKLTLDRLVRSLYRNKDGLLCVNEKNHKSAIDEMHNAICLYIYYQEAGMYMIDAYYVYAYDKPESYEEWCEIAWSAVDELNEKPPQGFYGVYGWITTNIRVSVIRNGDMMIKVDAEGATGVRISFNRRSKGGKARRGA